jgi:hypothetical protein
VKISSCSPAPSVSSSVHRSVKSAYSRSRGSFDGRGHHSDSDEQEFDNYYVGGEVTATFPSIAGTNETLGDSDESEWVQGWQEKTSSEVASLPIYPLGISSGYSYDGDESEIVSQSHAENVRIGINCIKRSMSELVADQENNGFHGIEPEREITMLKSKISQLELEVKRLNAQIIRVHVIVEGVLNILDCHNMINDGSDLEGLRL